MVWSENSARENLDSAGIADRAATGFSDHGVPSVRVGDAVSGGGELLCVWAKMIKILMLPEICLCVK